MLSRLDRYVPEGLGVPDELTPAAVAALGGSLRERAQPAGSIEQAAAAVEPLAEVARRWLSAADPIRAEALDLLPGHSPFPRDMWSDAFELMFAPITPDALRAFVHDELVDHFAPGRSRPGGRSDAAQGARFPSLIGQVLAGNVPAPAVQAIFCGLLAGAAQLVKAATEDQVWPVLLARSIAAVSAELGSRLAVVHWPGQSTPHNAALASSADAVVAFGRSQTIAAWTDLVASSRERKLADASQKPRGAGPESARELPHEGASEEQRGPESHTTRELPLAARGAPAALIAHGPRTSLELIELPGDEEPMRPLADAVARDVAMYDQQGCLSPQQVYLVESGRGLQSRTAAIGDPRPPAGAHGAPLLALAFARLLGEALEGLRRRWPIGDRKLGVRLAIRRARESARIRRLIAGSEAVHPPVGMGGPGRGESGEGDAGGNAGPWVPAALMGPRDRFDWTLLGTAGGSPQVGPGGRTVLLTRAASLDEAVEAIAPLAPLIQGAALHAIHGRGRLAERLARELAIPYVCRPGELQRPPFGWRNDNVRPLRSLLA